MKLKSGYARWFWLSRVTLLLAGLGVSTALWQDEALPEIAPAPSTRANSKVMVIRLSDEGKYMVDQVQADFIIESLDHAEENGYQHVILRIDTFGGIVFSAREITERLIRLGIPTTAYVETKAISAGVFIAWACDEIVMERLTTLGDAQMIFQTMEGKIEEAPEKAVTVYRSDWKKACLSKGRSFALAQGFFDVNAEVLLVGDKNQPEFILREDYDLLEENARLPIIEVVSKKGQLLTLSAEECEELGIVRVVDSFDDFLGSMKLGEGAAVEEVAMSFNQKVLRFLGANSWIYVILTLVGLNGIYMEIKAPGFGIPGLTALVCFSIIFGARYLLGTASPFEMVLFIAGVLLCLVEIFVLPGFGVAGITGIVAMLGGLVLASVPDFGGWPSYDVEWQWINSSVVATLISFTLSGVTILFVAPLVFRLPWAQRNMLPLELKASDGYVMNTVGAEDRLKGRKGVARGDLRPSGKVLLDDGRFLDVVAEGMFVDDGQRVRIWAIDGNRIVVRPEHEVSSSP